MDEISSKTSIIDPGMRARYARKFRNAQKAEFYGDDYLSVVDDKSESGPKCVFNEYVRANELRAWDVQMHQYTGIAYVMGSVNSTFSSCGATTELIRDFLPTFTGPFEQKMKMYAEFPESWYSLKDIKTKLQGVYDRFGLNRTAKATDLKRYIPCCKKKGYGADYSRINGYQFQRPQDNN